MTSNTCVLGIEQVFYLKTFSIAMYLYVFHINHKPGVTQMGATKLNHFLLQPTAY